MNLKKILPLLILIYTATFGQTVLSVQNLDLKKSEGFHEILAAPEANYHGLTVFAADKNTVTAQRYTRVLYYTDSLVAQHPDRNEYSYMAGYSYSKGGVASAYWAGNGYKNIQEQQFDFDNKKVTDYFYEFTYEEEDVVATFNKNNSFFILTLLDKAAKLKLYTFNDGRYVQRVIDFSGYSFVGADDKKTTFNKLIDDYGLQITDADSYSPLPDAVGKIKLYITPEGYTFTLNHNAKFTQIFTIDTASFTIKEQTVAQAEIKDATSNAYLQGGNLYQIVFNKEELALTRTNLDNVQDAKTFTAKADGVIGFKNSALTEQTPYHTKELKNTKKFLRRAVNGGGEAAISVYQTPNDILVVAGAIRMVVPASNVMMGLVIAAAGADPSEILPADVQSVYFESLFDEQFNHKDVPQQRLAADYIGRYIAGHNRMVQLESVFKYDYYYVLGFYDSKDKKYVLVRFEDDFVR